MLCFIYYLYGLFRVLYIYLMLIGNNSIQDEGAKYLAESLCKNTTLTKLNLRNIILCFMELYIIYFGNFIIIDIEQISVIYIIWIDSILYGLVM